MALTINPAVCRTRTRHLRTIMLHTCGAILGALATLAGIAVIYVGLRAAAGPAITWCVLSGAVAGGIARDFGLPATVTPNRRVQVPEWYRDAFSQEATAAIFGTLLDGPHILQHVDVTHSLRDGTVSRTHRWDMCSRSLRRVAVARTNRGEPSIVA